MRGQLTFAGHLEKAVAALPVRRNCACAVVVDGEFVFAYESKRDADLAGQIRGLALDYTGAAPERIVRFGRNQFPLTASGKVRRQDVAELVRNLHGHDRTMRK